METKRDMFEGDNGRGFGGGLVAWLRLGVGPATDAGRDMAFGRGFFTVLARVHCSGYARCSPPFEVAGEKRPINTGLSKHRSRAVTTPEAAAELFRP